VHLSNFTAMKTFVQGDRFRRNFHPSDTDVCDKTNRFRLILRFFVMMGSTNDSSSLVQIFCLYLLRQMVPSFFCRLLIKLKQPGSNQLLSRLFNRILGGIHLLDGYRLLCMISSLCFSIKIDDRQLIPSFSFFFSF
jgi:hypothetical protein